MDTLSTQPRESADHVRIWGEAAYLDMCRRILEQGVYRKPDGEEGRWEAFAQPLKFDLRDRKLPLLTTKRMQWKSLAVEMLWFISGSSKIDLLHENNVKIWDIWANEDNDVGPLYGYMWRHWWVDPNLVELNGGREEIDQLAQVIATLRDRPEARSHVITAWRPDWLKAMSIKPCHVYLQFYRVGDEVSLLLTQRSCDTFLGVPFNIAQYSLLTHLVAHQLGCTARDFTWMGGDVHIYENHVEQVQDQLTRPIHAAPRLQIHRRPDSIEGYRFDDFEVEGYQHEGPLKGEISAQGTPKAGTDIDRLRKLRKA
jgi:thymidylate synthase